MGENIRLQPVHTRARLGSVRTPGPGDLSQLTVEENLKIGLPARADKKKTYRSTYMTCSPCSRKCYIAGR